MAKQIFQYLQLFPTLVPHLLLHRQELLGGSIFFWNLFEEFKEIFTYLGGICCIKSGGSGYFAVKMCIFYDLLGDTIVTGEIPLLPSAQMFPNMYA